MYRQLALAIFPHAVEQECVLHAKVLEEINTGTIRSEFETLAVNIAKNLTEVGPNMEDFHQFVSALFEAGSSIPESGGITGIFRALTLKKYWDYLDVSNLEGIIEEFSGILRDENVTMIKQYKQRLSMYKTTTTIADIIRSNDESSSEEVRSKLANSNEGYDQKYQAKLSVTLASNRGFNSDMSILCLEELWNSICLEFSVPPLSQPLDSIEGNVHITPSTLLLTGTIFSNFCLLIGY